MSVLWAALGYFGLGSAIAGGIVGMLFLHPFSPRITDKNLLQAQQLGAVRELQLPPLSGWLIAHREGVHPTIVFLHGRSSNRMQMFSVAKAFFERGFNAVLLDSRRHGNSGGAVSYGTREIPDVLRVVDYVRRDPAVDPDRVYLLGFSFGAAIAIGAASVDHACAIRAVVADSPYASLRDTGFWYMRLFGRIPGFIVWPAGLVAVDLSAWIANLDIRHLNPADWAGSIGVPVLLIHGEKDRWINPDSSAQIFANLRSKKELWRVPGSGHTEAFRKNPAGYVDRVSTFFSTADEACIPEATD